MRVGSEASIPFVFFGWALAQLSGFFVEAWSLWGFVLRSERGLWWASGYAT